MQQRILESLSECEASQSQRACSVPASREFSEGNSEASTTSESSSVSSDETPALPRRSHRPVLLVQNPFSRSPPSSVMREPQPVRIKQERSRPTREREEPRLEYAFATDALEALVLTVIPRSLPAGGQSPAEGTASVADEESEAGLSKQTSDRTEDSHEKPSEREDSLGRNADLDKLRLQGSAVKLPQPARLKEPGRPVSNLPACDEDSTDNEARRHFDLPASWSSLPELSLMSIFSSNRGRTRRIPNLTEEADFAADEESSRDVGPKASASTATTLPPRTSESRTQTQEPAVPSTSSSSTTRSSRRRTGKRKHPGELLVPSKRSSSVTTPFPRRTETRKQPDEPAVPTQSSSSERVPFPRRTESRTQPDKPSVQTQSSSSRSTSFRRRTGVGDNPSRRASPTELTSSVREADLEAGALSVVKEPHHCRTVSPFGEIALFPHDRGYRSDPVRITGTLLDILPSLGGKWCFFLIVIPCRVISTRKKND